MKPRLTAVALLAITGLPAIAAASIVEHHTAAGTALAREALLVRGDLGGGWSASAAPRSVPPLTCPAFSPSLDGVERGAAASPTFSEGRAGPFVSQASYVYATASQAAVVWRRVVTPELVRCVAASLRGGGNSGVTFAVRSERLLTVPAVRGASTPAYRVAGHGLVPGPETNRSTCTSSTCSSSRKGDAITQIQRLRASRSLRPANELEAAACRGLLRGGSERTEEAAVSARAGGFRRPPSRIRRVAAVERELLPPPP